MRVLLGLGPRVTPDECADHLLWRQWAREYLRRARDQSLPGVGYLVEVRRERGTSPTCTEQEPPLPSFAGHLQSLVELDSAAAGRGLLSNAAPDGIVRRAPLFAKVQDVVALSFGTPEALVPEPATDVYSYCEPLLAKTNAESICVFSGW